jgi:hypothetical protein
MHNYQKAWIYSQKTILTQEPMVNSLNNIAMKSVIIIPILSTKFNSVFTIVPA